MFYRYLLLTLLLWPLVHGQNGPLTKDQIIQMSNAGVSEDVIVGKINSEQNLPQFNAADFITMKLAGVSDGVIRALATLPYHPAVGSGLEYHLTTGELDLVYAIINVGEESDGYWRETRISSHSKSATSDVVMKELMVGQPPLPQRRIPESEWTEVHGSTGRWSEAGSQTQRQAKLWNVPVRFECFRRRARRNVGGRCTEAGSRSRKLPTGPYRCREASVRRSGFNPDHSSADFASQFRYRCANQKHQPSNRYRSSRQKRERRFVHKPRESRDRVRHRSRGNLRMRALRRRCQRKT